MHWFLAIQIIDAELVHNLFRRNLALFLRNPLDNICKFLVHSLWKTESVEAVHDKGNPALAGLAVDAHYRLVFPADIARIDRKVRHFPYAVCPLCKSLHSFVNGILMGTGECGKYQLSCIRMSRIHRHLGTALADLRNLLDILNFQSGIYPL